MPSLNYISRLTTRFHHATGDRDKPDLMTRDIGGHYRNNQPHINGYFQVMFGLPNELFGDAYVEEASKWLHSSCESFTPHGENSNKVDVMGIGQTGSSFAASRTTSREITLAFREYQNFPILNIIRRWSSVFDPYTGVSPLDGNRFIPLNYKGWVAVAQIKPVRSMDGEDGDLTADDIEECYIYQGVFPTNVPTDATSDDISSNDTIQLSVTFSFDGYPLTSAEPGITDTVINLYQGMRYIDTYNKALAEGLNARQFGTHEGKVTTRTDPVKSNAEPTKVEISV